MVTVPDHDFVEFATARWSALTRAAIALGCDVHQAQDLTQTTLLRCYLKWSRVAAARDRDAYVATVMINLHRSAQRRGRGTRDLLTGEVPDLPTPAAADQIETIDVLRRALDALSAPQREVVALRYYVQLSEIETAEVLRVPVGTVKSRLSRALAALALDATLDDLREER